jgi:serine protease
LHLANYAQAAFAAPTPDFEPNDSLFHYQYNLYNYGQTGGTFGIDIGAKSAWNFTMGDSNVVVAILDEGFIYNHEDLDVSKILWSSGYDFVGDNYKTPHPDNNPISGDSTNHGVACQGIICAGTNNQIGISGIAPNCYFLPIKCADDFGGWSWNPLIYENALSYALHYSINNGCSMVVSCSWGWPNGSFYSNIDSIITVMASWGIACVFSTGNLGEYLPIGNTIKFPASLPSTIGVGAIKKTGDHWAYSGSGEGIDVVAPSGYYRYYDAGDIMTLDQMGQLGWNPIYTACAITNDNYICTFGGTSAAAPQVASIIALLKSEYSLRPEMEVFTILKMVIDSSAMDGIGDNYDSVGWDPVYGYGLANAFRALLAVVRGDVNNDKIINIIDINYLLNFLYRNGPPLQPDVRVGDADCDGRTVILDVGYLIDYLYKGGPKPQICFKY